MRAKGTFEVKMSPEPPYDTADGVSLGRIAIEKVFVGELEATSTVNMISARSAAVPNSAGYVAIERVRGSLAGRAGSFVLQHSGTMTRGVPTLALTVVPDSGTGELATLSGKMAIDIIDGKHFYTFEYEL